VSKTVVNKYYSFTVIEKDDGEEDTVSSDQEVYPDLSFTGEELGLIHALMQNVAGSALAYGILNKLDAADCCDEDDWERLRWVEGRNPIGGWFEVDEAW
jgi:hypothetical protein